MFFIYWPMAAILWMNQLQVETCIRAETNCHGERPKIRCDREALNKLVIVAISPLSWMQNACSGGNQLAAHLSCANYRRHNNTFYVRRRIPSSALSTRLVPTFRQTLNAIRSFPYRLRTPLRLTPRSNSLKLDKPKQFTFGARKQRGK